MNLAFCFILPRLSFSPGASSSRSCRGICEHRPNPFISPASGRYTRIYTQKYSGCLVALSLYAKSTQYRPQDVNSFLFGMSLSLEHRLFMAPTQGTRSSVFEPEGLIVNSIANLKSRGMLIPLQLTGTTGQASGCGCERPAGVYCWGPGAGDWTPGANLAGF